MKTNRADRMTRRRALATGASGVVGTAAMAAGGTWGAGCAHTPPSAGGLGDPARAGGESLADLGMKPIVNAAGTITTLGGSLMAPEVLAAWNAASRHFVDLPVLQDRVGEKLAALLGVEAALVTTGAAGAILVGTAGVITRRAPALAGCLPATGDQVFEVIHQKAHKDCYDRMVTACGATLVEVETAAQFEAAINERTVMTLSYNYLEPEGQIGHDAWLTIAKKHHIPTLLDAAADTPPIENLSRFCKMGFDLVAFSGGKAIGGPQDTGLLLGRRDLIEAAKRNTAPRCSVGRGLKVGKEDMVALYAAVKRWVNLDHDGLWRVWEARAAVIEKALCDIPTVRCERIVPPIANRVPHLLVFWDESRLGRARVKKDLWEGDPAIATARVHGTGEAGFLLSVFQLQDGEDKIVASRLRAILGAALAQG